MTTFLVLTLVKKKGSSNSFIGFFTVIWLGQIFEIQNLMYGLANSIRSKNLDIQDLDIQNIYINMWRI